MKVKDIMRKIIVIDDSLSVKQAAKIMNEKKVGSLIVIAGSKIRGIITERDILTNVGVLDENVKKIMSKDVITISPDASLDEAAQVMAEHEIKRLPVLDGDELVGIVTATNLIANADEMNEDFFFDD